MVFKTCFFKLTILTLLCLDNMATKERKRSLTLEPLRFWLTLRTVKTTIGSAVFILRYINWVVFRLFTNVFILIY